MSIYIAHIDVIMMLFIFGATSLGAIGAFFLKLGSNKFYIKFSPKFFSELFANHKLLLGIMFYAISTVCFVLALKRGELSVVYPLTSISYIFISLLSVRFLKERMNIYKIFGIVFIILGVTLVTM
jgi:uncharacterized membrane protein